MITKFYTSNPFSSPSSSKNFSSSSKIYLNKSKLSADIKCAEIESDVSILSWNLKEDRNYTFVKEPDLNEADHCFTLVYFLKTNAASVSTNNEPAKRLVNIQEWGLFANNDALTEINFTGGEPVKGLSIVFTAGWLQKQFLNSGLFLDIDSIRNHSSDLFKNTSEENILIKKLLASIEDNRSILTVKSHFYSLVYGMIKHVTAEKKAVKSALKNPVMQAVEDVIIGSVKGKMPALKQLAKQFFMSVASLKRHFKLTFGSSIYNYFLSKKMEYAKEMLLSAESVKEVCYALSYENVSHFTSIFKKYHACCPSQICNKRYYISQYGQNKNYTSIGRIGSSIVAA